ncbi:hypothetical protein OBBRIDRAFT_808299 [Obba rivulosa]|uniref:Uncharacterized protein n=1 Tax=Obba rivulosa TaxID=1052685 RepID=A0A8E2AM40_9APHY|nr:hypothetical protein OBBRIDRAFT_808299 [Obba rivulosa]
MPSTQTQKGRRSDSLDGQGIPISEAIGILVTPSQVNHWRQTTGLCTGLERGLPQYVGLLRIPCIGTLSITLGGSLSQLGPTAVVAKAAPLHTLLFHRIFPIKLVASWQRHRHFNCILFLFGSIRMPTLIPAAESCIVKIALFTVPSTFQMGCVFSLPLPLRCNCSTTEDEPLGTIVPGTVIDGLAGGRADGLEGLPEVMEALEPRDESVAPGMAVTALPSRSIVRSLAGESLEGTPILTAQTSLKGAGWLRLKTVLVAVKEGSDLFPPLKIAVVGVLGIFEVIDCVGEAQDGFLEIARKIEGIQEIFSRYQSEKDIPFFISERLQHLSARTIEAPGDVKDIESVFGELANMVENFKVR